MKQKQYIPNTYFQYRILISITIQRGLRNKMIDMIIEKIVSWQDIQLNGQNNCLGTRNHKINCYVSIYKFSSVYLDQNELFIYISYLNIFHIYFKKK